MAGLYVDTSALGRVLLAEPDAEAIRDTMARTRHSGLLRYCRLSCGALDVAKASKSAPRSCWRRC
jgi:hypothetical protein